MCLQTLIIPVIIISHGNVTFISLKILSQNIPANTTSCQKLTQIDIPVMSRCRMVQVRAVRRVLMVAREVAMESVSDTWPTRRLKYFLSSQPAPSTSFSVSDRFIVILAYIPFFRTKTQQYENKNFKRKFRKKTFLSCLKHNLVSL